MVKIWDGLTKRLMQAGPQDLISWMFPGAVYEGELNTELLKDPIRADMMYTMKWKGREVALHIEFQKRRHGRMDRRVWEYNVLTSVRTGLPVYSVVIYLVKDGSVAEPPYSIEWPTGEIIHHFVFRNVKLWEIPAEVLLEQNLPGLLPLLPLTQEGDRREVVEQMIGRLQQVGRKDLLALGHTFSALMLKKESDQQWLREKFMSMEDILEESWYYQKILQKGIVEGMAKGMVEGMTKGMEQGVEQGLQALRTTLIRFVEVHFPDQLALAEQQIELTTTPSQVQEMLDKLFVARTNDDVRKILLALPHA